MDIESIRRIAKSLLALMACGALLAACGGAAVPQDALTAAEASVKGAEVGGAAENPKAALHLKLAKEQIEKAKKAIAEDENEEAKQWIDRAQADADLALALAKEAKARADAAEANDQLAKLKSKLGK
jgi:hypothetical protein